MEVHHAHHPSHKKNWGEYLLEFFMLFVAVTMGFFAENIRENSVIQHKMKENYEALLEDLRQDSAKTVELFDSAETREPNLVKLKYMLFRYHKKTIDWLALRNEYKQLGRLPSYSTLFINNTTFKNMQSTGLLSDITNYELKSKLSFYYEVMFKRLEDNNKLFDQAGILFLHTQMAHKQSIEIQNGKDVLLKEYPNEFANRDSYAEYMLDLPSTKQILTSDNLVYAVDAYSGRYYNYFNILHEIFERNKELIKIIQSNTK